MLPIDPLIGSSIIDGGVSLLGGLFGRKNQSDANKANLQIARENNAAAAALARENNQFQLGAMREQNEWNKQTAIDMFNLENEYNSPIRQMERLREAGLNPAAVMGGNLSVANSGNISTPTASGSGVSSSMPSLTTPVMQPLPSIVSGSINAFKAISEIALNKSKSGESDANAQRTLNTMEAEISKYWADAKNSEANAAYKTTQNNLLLLYGDEYNQGLNKQQVQKLQNMAAEYAVLMQQEKYVEAQKMYQKAQTNLTNSNNELVKKQTPLILDNLKKVGRMYVDQAAAYRASANQSNATASLTKEQAETIRQNRPNVVELTRNQARESAARAKVAESTTMEQIESWRNKVKLQGKQAEELDEAIRRAKKSNDWFEVNQVIDILSKVSDEALGWATLGVSKMGRTTSTHTEHYDNNGDMTGYTDSVNRYLYE